MYDYYIDPLTQEFKHWRNLVTTFKFDPDVPVSNMFVQTADSSSMSYLLDTLFDMGKPVRFLMIACSIIGRD